MIARACALLVVFLIALGGDAPYQVAPASSGQDQGAYRITVDVDLVLLQATVRDGKGRLVSDLREQDFQVYEDGVPQRIRLFQ